MSHEKGQSLAEVMVATTVGILVVSALTFATIYSIRNANFAKNSAQATKLAQEGIEWVRTGRDRNSAITNNFKIGSVDIASWNGNSSVPGAIWDYQIDGNCGDNDPVPPIVPTYCYFNIDTVGKLNYLGSYPSIPPLAQSVGQFKRVVILSDEATNDRYLTQKRVTVIVAWDDFAGSHESRLVTILGKI